MNPELLRRYKHLIPNWYSLSWPGFKQAICRYCNLQEDAYIFLSWEEFFEILEKNTCYRRYDTGDDCNHTQ